jgi:hypothetical protein
MLLREDESILVRVGRWDGHKAVKLECTWPGRKRARGELPHHALDALLQERLDVFRPHVTFKGSATEVEESESASLGIHTEYLRTVHEAEFNDTAELSGVRWLVNTSIVIPSSSYDETNEVSLFRRMTVWPTTVGSPT